MLFKPTETTGMFNKGDLFFLNEDGKNLFCHIDADHGLVMSDPYLLYQSSLSSSVENQDYYGYDILIKGRLFREIPKRLLLRLVEHEKTVE